MKKQWNPDTGGIVEVIEPESVKLEASFRIQNFYFQILKDKSSGKRFTGWTDETGFNEVMGKIGLKREMFKVIPLEQILLWMNQK